MQPKHGLHRRRPRLESRKSGSCHQVVDVPHLAKHAFRDQIGPNVQKAMLPGSPSHQGLKNCGFSQKYFFHFLTISFSFW